jgi:hypothetical protein
LRHLRDRSASGWFLTCLTAATAFLPLACRSDERAEREESGATSDAGSEGSAPANRAGSIEQQGGSPEPDQHEIQQVRLARATLAHAGIPLYPQAEGLDSTEFEANGVPFISVDFFSVDPPEKVVAFYDRELKDRTSRRDTVIEPGAVRYEFERRFSGLSVRPWDPKGADSTAMLARFDRRDALGVTSQELDAYGLFLGRARSHVVVNLPRPDPGPVRS